MWLCTMEEPKASWLSTPVPAGTTLPPSSISQSLTVVLRVVSVSGSPVFSPLPTRTPPMPRSCSQLPVMAQCAQPASHHTP